MATIRTKQGSATATHYAAYRQIGYPVATALRHALRDVAQGQATVPAQGSREQRLEAATTVVARELRQERERARERDDGRGR